jgi:hypothetical protein
MDPRWDHAAVVMSEQDQLGSVSSSSETPMVLEAPGIMHALKLPATTITRETQGQLGKLSEQRRLTVARMV